MKIQSLSSNQINAKTTSFKSVYPVYHWCKVNGKYRPVSDKKSVENCQQLLTGMLGNGYKVNLQKKHTSFLSLVVEYISEADIDYKYGHYVRSYYYDDGGVRYDSAGKPCGIEPCAYLLTGVDATEYERAYGEPIGLMAKRGKCSDKRVKRTVNRARAACVSQGLNYLKEKCKKFKDKESNAPLELHVIYTQSTPENKLRISKMEFFKTGDKENPLVRNNIIPA